MLQKQVPIELQQPTEAYVLAMEWKDIISKRNFVKERNQKTIIR